MGKTSIEWTDASWNPIVGCTEISPGCANCYAARLAATRLKNLPDYKGLTTIGTPVADADHGKKMRPHWNDAVRLLPARLAEPEQWRRPQRIFVCDMGDLFHESVGQGALLCVFQAMANAPQHTYQILTKRAQRMKEWLAAFQLVERHRPMRDDCRWPWPNVWCGVSTENQHFADERIPLLLETPAAVRWISAEPLLGPVDLAHKVAGKRETPAYRLADDWVRCLDWVVAGGESGPNARPMHPQWARSLRNQCQASGVPFFFKQWGEWADPRQSLCALHSAGAHDYVADGREHSADCPNAKTFMVKCGKKVSGRLLDGREWSEFPCPTSAK